MFVPPPHPTHEPAQGRLALDDPPQRQWALRSPTEALTGFAPPAGFSLGRAERHQPAAARYGFRTGSLSVLIGRATGSEVMEARRIAPLPGADTWLVGMMNLRGTPVPVFDLCTALGLPANDASQKSMVLVLGKGEHAVGFLIDGLPRALTALRPIDVPSLPPALAPFVAAAWSDGAGLWIEFDPLELLSSHLVD
jgi:chemotaxis signal transduction protein